MTNLPEKVVILGIPHKIVYCDKGYEVDESNKYRGMLLAQKAEIRILSDADRPVEDVLNTLWHEIIHAIGLALHIERIASSGITTEDVDERTVDLLALGVTNVLLANGWLKFDTLEAQNE